MNRLFIVLLAVMAIATETVVAMGYYGQPQYGQPQYGQPQYGQPQGQPQYGHPYGQQFPQQHYGQSCSRQDLMRKQQKNAVQCQQETLGCQYGDSRSCGKAQKDCFDAQKYAHMVQQCLYP